MLIGLPLLGITIGGRDVLSYLEFPPLTRYVEHAPFNWWAFVIIGSVDLLMVIGMGILSGKAIQKRRRKPNPKRVQATFPAWGWIGAAVMIVGWLMAWTRFAWFEPLQAHTFCMPWIGYILLANALSVQRSGHSLLTDVPKSFLLLWPSSALFWWFFEYLNRFVQNWYYVGVEKFSPLEYVIHASLAFATVLPAVVSTLHLLLTFRVLNAGFSSFASVTFMDDKPTAVLILFIAGSGLTLMGRYPDYLYPLVWGAPLLVITSFQTLWGKPTIFSNLKDGDWRLIFAGALAALICGFFWELWNYKSLARWEYAIPFVDRFHIFAMPVLGYGGYLPFGLECLLIGQMVLGSRILIAPTER
jgi:hypothetical protein